ncbi:BZ3500_MvSof-1268-A1-R1_Chr8-1g09951 [Microbotryum saponariae]|uniref:BZ3500_MvSof-1268-A1-R1_Chr8-1g09951 protein n=1 Tax=Microbotryum saponariae TaxID=289078 RepID=A0A2X0NQY7_9BASI|nr:BZ3500_MvSof-1268-A1-R1_Chr8-1g09951 [Microbotryum saponariae]SDA08237.1 BZ3501_MvSof-1269-A2-R1_Chr8-1g09674 [Microbotryum saponariae]
MSTEVPAAQARASARTVSPTLNSSHFHRSPSVQISKSSAGGSSWSNAQSSTSFAPGASNGLHSDSVSPTTTTIETFPGRVAGTSDVHQQQHHEPHHQPPSASVNHPHSSSHAQSHAPPHTRSNPTPADHEPASSFQKWGQRINQVWSNVAGQNEQDVNARRFSTSTSAMASTTTAHLRTPTLGRPPIADQLKLSSARSRRSIPRDPSSSRHWILSRTYDRIKPLLATLYVTDADGDSSAPWMWTPFFTPGSGHPLGFSRRRSSFGSVSHVPPLSRSGWLIVGVLFLLGLREIVGRSSFSGDRRRNVKVSGRSPYSVIHDLSPAERISSYFDSPSSSATPAILAGQDRIWKREYITTTDDRFDDATGPRGDTTAIVLHWKRTENVIVIVSHLCRYKFFDSITVWNNNPAVQLQRSDFDSAKCPPSKLRIYNSPRNQLFVARYLACAQARTAYCYFQDDDWLVWPLRALYSQFSRDPEGPVVVHTNPQVASLYALEWCFYAAPPVKGNDDFMDSKPPAQIHTCFAWMGTGAFVSKSRVIHYLANLTDVAYPSVELAHADNSFTTFLNQPPYVLSSELTQLPQPFGHSNGKGIARNKAYIHQGIQHLYKYLDIPTTPSKPGEKFKLPSKPLLLDTHAHHHTSRSSKLPPHPYTHHVRSPCHTDTCNFITSVALLPPPDSVPYPGPEKVGDLETWENHLGWTARGWIEGNELFREEETFANKWAYAHAVDGRDETAFRSPDVIKMDDYVGLALLTPAEPAWTPALTFVFVLEHWAVISKSVVFEVSLDGYKWFEPLSPPSAPSCQGIATQSSLPDHSFPPSTYLSSRGQAILEAEVALFSGNKVMTWFHRRRRRSEPLKRCRIRIGTKFERGNAEEGWRFVRMRSLGELEIGWGVYEMGLEKSRHRRTFDKVIRHSSWWCNISL